ncbi:V-set domain-containing T-cell activation inhibitor 1-like, partial [Silurus meridionalis]
VEVVQGDSVILPCSAGGNEKDIFWRHNNTKTVYDIIESKEDFDDQDAAFRGRVEGFPSKFTEGNYSIRLKNVIHSDAGNYSCHIPNTKTVHVELRLRGSSESIAVEADPGDSVILPCLAGGNEKDVFWRHHDDKTVYDIIEGKEDFHDQDAAYRGRVKGFPSKYGEGNFSIRLSDVIHSDAGFYNCHIP